MYDEVLMGLGFQPSWVPMDDDDWETPCIRGTTKDYLEEYSLGQGANEILKGNFDPNIAANMPALNHCLQHNIQQVAVQGSIKVEISLQDYKDLFNSQDESTSSSPSDRHYGHYQAAL
eukprot:10865673-Ditylum_brightwellii.AAC.1